MRVKAVDRMPLFWQWSLLYVEEKLKEQIHISTKIMKQKYLHYSTSVDFGIR